MKDGDAGEVRPTLPAPAAPPSPVATMTATDRWYLECLTQLTAIEGRAVSCLELGNWIGRSNSPVYRHMTRLENFGYVGRDERRRFVPLAIERAA